MKKSSKISCSNDQVRTISLSLPLGLISAKHIAFESGISELISIGTISNDIKFSLFIPTKHLSPGVYEKPKFAIGKIPSGGLAHMYKTLEEGQLKIDSIGKEFESHSKLQTTNFVQL